MTKNIIMFRHTQYAIYLVAIFAVSCVLIDSAQGVVERFNLNRRWYYLFGATCLFAYLYVRPQIRLRLGSASHARINWSTIYIVWLCSAVFCHLPSLESLGIDLRADVSILLITFLLSAVILGVAAALHAAALALGWIRPWLAHQSTVSVVVLHAMNIALACSTYRSFCKAGEVPGTAQGADGPVSAAGWAAAAVGRLLRASTAHRSPWREAVCQRWLAPVPVSAFPAFGNWVIYAADQDAAATTAPPSGTETISPIFTLWLTLSGTLAATCLADYAASSVLNQAAVDARQNESMLRLRRQGRRLRRRSAGSMYDLRPRRGGAMDLDAMSPVRSSFDALVRTMSSVGNLWSPRKLRAASSLLLFRDDLGLDLGRLVGGGGGMGDQSPKTPGSGRGAVTETVIADDAPAPRFLPMFPWYSGTSADLLKTMFDLVISVKLFLGRFDNRTLQSVTELDRVPGSDGVPQDGDGFTFEHLADRRELWVDFCADTGDGGDSTYAVARCLAAPSLTVDVPPPTTKAAEAEDAETRRLAAALDGEGPGRPRPRVRRLPRGRVLLHGGDLAYPNPTEETYRRRLFSVYDAALPPPAHARRGSLVVDKPDVGPGLRAALPRCLPGCPRGAAAVAGACQACRKAAALRRYEGPSAFAIPGNHDWIDGLETFSRHVLHRGWLGGWLLPQEKSYWSLRLPSGWWVLGLDLALVDDIDTAQYRYFARLAEARMGPEDRAVIVLHCPRWLMDWFWGTQSAPNLRHLLRGPLRGRARVAIAGDLHFYMRHSFRTYDTADAVPSVGSTPAGASPPSGASPGSSRSATPLPQQAQEARGVSPTAIRARIASQLQGFRRRTASGESRIRAGTAADQAPGPARSSSTPILTSVGDGHAAATDAHRTAATNADRSPIPRAVQSEREREEARQNLVGGPLPHLGQSLSEAVLARAAERARGHAELRAGSSPFAPAGRGDWGAETRFSPRTGIGRAEGPERSGPAAPLPALTPIVTTSDRAAPWGRPIGGVGGGPDTDTEGDGGAWAPLGCSPRESGAMRGDSGLGSPPALSSQGLGSEPSGSSSAFTPSWWPELRARQPPTPFGSAPGPAVGGSPGVAIPGVSPRGDEPDGCLPRSLSVAAAAAGWRLSDPEHLIVSGSGGAFLHPTHVFAYARFRPQRDPAAGPTFIKRHALGTGYFGGGHPASDVSTDGLDVALQREGTGFLDPPTGEYRCSQSFPSPMQSLELGKRNLHMFRNMNSRFDIIGGALYFLLVVSVLPRCERIRCVLDAPSLTGAAALLWNALCETILEIVLESYVSLAVMVVLFFITLGFASTGGVGARGDVSPADRQKPELQGQGLAVRARLGGLSTRVLFAGLHTAAHVLAAVGLLLLLELGIETVIRHEHVGDEGYHSLYKWYRDYEAQHFPDPYGVRQAAEKLTLGLYPNLIQWTMALYDIPEAIAVARKGLCAGAPGMGSLTRLQGLGYYGGMLAYYWLLATPVVALLFGSYLYICVNWFGVHYDEAFSSLQVPDHKGFLRMHVTADGDLEIFSLGIDAVPTTWREDPSWRGATGAGAPGAGPGWKARTPSRWAAVHERAGRIIKSVQPEHRIKCVDYIYVPKRHEAM